MIIFWQKAVIRNVHFKTDKVRRLEALLTKCKESIKANKQKTNALTEVKDALSQQLSEKEAELSAVNESYSKVNVELEALRKREQEDELQIAQTKMHMHQVRDFPENNNCNGKKSIFQFFFRRKSSSKTKKSGNSGPV